MNWIKIEEATPDKANVLRLADALGLHPAHALGLCVTFWALASQHMEPDGRLELWTASMIDRRVDQAGFTAAMIGVGWIIERGGELAVASPERHLSSTAKGRAKAAQRQARRRESTETDSPQPARAPQPRRAERSADDATTDIRPTEQPTGDGATEPRSRTRDGRSATPVTVERDARHAGVLRGPLPEKRREEEEKNSGGAQAQFPPPEPTGRDEAEPAGAPPPPRGAARGRRLSRTDEATLTVLAAAELVAEGFGQVEAEGLVRRHGAEAVGMGLSVARHRRDHPAPNAKPIANFRGFVLSAITERWPAPIEMGRAPARSRDEQRRDQERAKRAAMRWWTSMDQDERERVQAAALRCAVEEGATVRAARLRRESPHVGNATLAVMLHGLVDENAAGAAREAVRG